MNDEIAAALDNVAIQLRKLGTNDASTAMGAIELLASELKDGCEAIAYGLHDVANAIRETTEGS